MSNKRPFMPFYVADYLVDTLNLTTEEHGAYMLLLIAMWNAGGTLPNDAKALAGITKTGRRWPTVRKAVMPYFLSDGEKLWHKRINKEIKRVAELSETRAKAGRKGGIAKNQLDKALHQNQPPVGKQESLFSDVDSAVFNDLEMAIARPPRARSRDSRPRLTQTQNIDSSLRSESLAPENPPEGNSEKNSKHANVHRALETVLSPAVAAAVIEHRRIIRHPLTPYAANLLAKSFSAALSVCNLSADQAANQMIAHGWRGFEPEWLLNKPYATGPPRQGFADDGGRQSAEDTAFLESFIDEQRKRS